MKTPHFCSYIIGCQLVFLATAYTNAQAPVEALFTTYKNTAAGAKAYTATPAPNSGTFNGCAKDASSYSFKNGTKNGLLLTDITVNGFNYMLTNSAPATIKLRRVNNAAVTGNRHIIFLESVTAPATGCPGNKQYRLKSPYLDDMELFLNNNYVNQGTDNIFTNAGNGDGNNNNIERVDVVFSNGVSSSIATQAGFALFDRGINNAHDPFRIAAITAINTNGDPIAFGPVRTCVGGNGSNNGSWGHPSHPNGNQDLSVYVMRREAAETQLRSSAAINQQLGGVFFSLADLGIKANQVIYGYAILSTDGIANPTSSQLLDIADQTVYPTNTTEAVGGGLDLIAVNAFFQTAITLIGQEITLKGSLQDNKAVLQWSLKELPINSQAELQHSMNGRDFTTFYSFSIPGTSYTASYTDPAEGYAFYRLKLNVSGYQPLYSNIIQVKGSHHTILLYPTRIQPTQPVQLKGLPEGPISIRIVSALGTICMATVTSQNGIGVIEPPPAGFVKGLYLVSVIDCNNTTRNAKLVVY